MKLLTKAIMREMPALYSQEEKGLDALVRVKFFTPDANWTWYATEASAIVDDGEDGTKYVPLDHVAAVGGPEPLDVVFFGYVDGLAGELGYFNLSELEKVRGRFGLPVERDLFFQPVPVRKVMRQSW